MKTLAVYSIKGGVGKTAAAVNLAYLSAAGGKSTLLCDLDPQGSATFYFRIKAKVKSGANLLLKGGKKVFSSIKGTDYENLDLLPGDFSFRRLDLVFDQKKKSTRLLRQFLMPLAPHYEVVILDCPPNLTLVSENIFEATKVILNPVVPTTLSVRTLEQLTQFFKKAKNRDPILIPFFSMVEARKSMHRDLMNEMQGQFGDTFLKTIIPYRAEVEKMGLHHAPVFEFAAESAVAGAYRDLFTELNTRF